MKKIFLLGFVLCATASTAFGVRAGAGVLQEGGRANVYYRDGARFALEGRLVEAANAFEQAVALDPTNGNAYYSLGNVYSELGRWADAVNAYYKAISLKKDDVEAHNNLGIALSRRGQYAQAAAAFERAIKIYPKWAEPYYHLSQVRRELHQDAEAQAAYNRAIRLRPDYASQPPRTFESAGTKPSTPPRNNILVVANAVNAGSGLPENINTAPAATPDAGSSNPGSSKAVTPKAAATAATDETVSKSARPDSMDAKAYYDLGVKESRAGRYDEAALDFRRAIFLDRKNAGAYLALGDAYAAQGSWRDSVDAYEQAARLNPDDAEIYQRLGRSYAKLRETTPAPESLNGAPTVGVKAAAPSGAIADAGRPSEKDGSRGSVGGTAGEAGGRGVAPRGAASRPNVDEPTTKLNVTERSMRHDAVEPAARPGVAGFTPPTDDGLDPTAVYRVGPGDVLDIRVLKGREHRTTTYELTPTGLLAYPTLSEPLKVAGLTTEQVAARLGAELKLRAGGTDPEIAVGVREYVSHAIIVSGMVRDAGTKILQREGVPLYVIIAYAQPLPEAGQALVVAHATGRSTAVDLSDARAMKMLVHPGDVVTVRLRPAQYLYIAGAVRQPGQRQFHAGLTLTQALLAAGGALPQGASVVSVTRQDDDGRLSTKRYSLPDIKAGKVPDPLMQPGDRVEVLR